MSKRPVDKGRVRRSFSRAASTYESHSELQRRVAAELLERLPSGLVPGFALDVGCGTGRVKRALDERYPGAIVSGCDIALPMLRKAAELSGASSEPALTSADCEALPFKKDSFDLVVSSLTYQWAADMDAALAEAGRVLRPGGLFLFSTLSDGTLTELSDSVGALTRLMGFVEADALRASIISSGFEVRELSVERRVARYDDLWGLLRTLKRIGAFGAHRGGSKTLARGAYLKGAAVNYRDNYPSRDGSGVMATYEIIFAALNLPEGAL